MNTWLLVLLWMHLVDGWRAQRACVSSHQVEMSDILIFMSRNIFNVEKQQAHINTHILQCFNPVTSQNTFYLRKIHLLIMIKFVSFLEKWWWCYTQTGWVTQIIFCPTDHVLHLDTKGRIY